MKVIRKPGDAAKSLEIMIKGLGNKVGKVGWNQNARYPADNKKKAVQVAYVAAIQEYGYPSGNIPARPFIRPTIIKRTKAWMSLAAAGAKAILLGKTTPHAVMEAIGQTAAADIRKTITQVDSPPLKESTIKARLRKRSDKKTVGFLNKPLIDTKLMYGTLINTVEDE